MQPWYFLLNGSSLPPVEDIGGKARSLARLHQLDLACPVAFVLPTQVCHAYTDLDHKLPPEAEEALHLGIACLEESSGKQFGQGSRPLLLSVRSGAPVSMPGMMDTVLNLGINDAVEQTLATESLDVEFARDTHRRFVLSYGRIVLKADLDDETAAPDQLRAAALVETGQAVPVDPWEQLRGAVCAVLDSWQSSRSRAYRRHMNIPDSLGTAVTIQEMVFGNLGANSGTGVLFSRDPLSGAREPYGEYLPGGQGEDVVSGERTPLSLSDLAEQLPAVYEQLLHSAQLLEQEDRDMQDIEFTVEQGRLYLLQSRRAKRAPASAVRLAVDFVDDGLITEEEALNRITVDQVEHVLRPRLGDHERNNAVVLALGEAASPGVATGVALSDPDEVERRAKNGESVVFVTTTTSPEHVQAMISSVAVCTETGGSTSHAAVVCRGLGRPAVVGCGVGVVGELEGREVTVVGDTGQVFVGRLLLHAVDEVDEKYLSRLREWVTSRIESAVSDEEGEPRDTRRPLTSLLSAYFAARASSSTTTAALTIGTPSNVTTSNDDL
jgi:pyruvate,orthophosphate dikinase